MSRYEYTDTSGRTLSFIRPTVGKGYVLLGADYERTEAFIHIAKTDAPTVAAELLKAAGHDDLAGYIEAVIAQRDARAEREAAEKKLQERRQSVLRDLGHAFKYESLGLHAPMRKAIDRIIELEDARD